MLGCFAIPETLMSEWDLLLTDARIATMRQGEPDYGTIDGGADPVDDARPHRLSYAPRLRRPAGR